MKCTWRGIVTVLLSVVSMLVLVSRHPLMSLNPDWSWSSTSTSTKRAFFSPSRTLTDCQLSWSSLHSHVRLNYLQPAEENRSNQVMVFTSKQESNRDPLTSIFLTQLLFFMPNWLSQSHTELSFVHSHTDYIHINLRNSLTVDFSDHCPIILNCHVDCGSLKAGNTVIWQVKPNHTMM